MLQANSKEKEQTALDEINEAIKSYRAKMTKAQLK
jgi:Na+/phosphate symporter